MKNLIQFIALLVTFGSLPVFAQIDPELLERAEEGETEAQCELGSVYATGGYLAPQYQFGSKAHLVWKDVPQDYIKAEYWFRKAAEQGGDSTAQFNLGLMYVHGQGVQKDISKAVQWFKKAAEQGHAEAQLLFGGAYIDGVGVKQDYLLAFGWFQKAAEQGNVVAQNNLGIMYRNGQGVTQDYFKAAEWFRKAVEHEDATAQFDLGVLYFNGQGVIRDQQKGCGLMRTSAEQGFRPAIEEYNRLCPADYNKSPNTSGHRTPGGGTPTLAMRRFLSEHGYKDVSEAYNDLLPQDFPEGSIPTLNMLRFLAEQKNKEQRNLNTLNDSVKEPPLFNDRAKESKELRVLTFE